MAESSGRPYLLVLGIAQDGGVPQAGCRRACCAAARANPRRRRHAACIAVVDPRSGGRWLIDATPDLREQLARLDRAAPAGRGRGLRGIFLTHAHVGHYAGLVHLGREAMAARDLPVFAMPRMTAFLRRHAPWEMLVRLKNIRPRVLRSGRAVSLTAHLSVTPVPVPHRGEYSETVAYRIDGPRASALWLPDIDAWERWTMPVEKAIAGVDAAWLDGTFFSDGELVARDMTEVPHPRITATLERLAALPRLERRKVRFVHLNHTNPALHRGAARRLVERAGFRVAEEGERFEM